MLRRLFLSRVSAAPAMLAVAQPAPAAPTSAARFEAARHPEDVWLDAVPGRHRVVFDTWMAANFEEAVGFAGNYLRANKDVYGLDEGDLALVIVVRHRTAPFAFNDAIWAKYGKTFATRMSFTDPSTHEAPTRNVYAERVSKLVKQGVHFAVCNLTTRAYSRMIAEQSGVAEDKVYAELTSNTLGNAHFVAAGVVGVTRAQEHGYVLVSVG